MLFESLNTFGASGRFYRAEKTEKNRWFRPIAGASSRRGAVPRGNGMDARSRAVPALVWHDDGGCGTALRPLQPSSPDLDSGSRPLPCYKQMRWWLWHGFVSSSAVIPHLMRDPSRCGATSCSGAVSTGHGMGTRSRAVPALVWHDGGGFGTALRSLQPSSPDLDSGSIPLWCLTLKWCSSDRSRNGYQIARSACTCLA